MVIQVMRAKRRFVEKGSAERYSSFSCSECEGTPSEMLHQLTLSQFATEEILKKIELRLSDCQKRFSGNAVMGLATTECLPARALPLASRFIACSAPQMHVDNAVKAGVVN